MPINYSNFVDCSTSTCTIAALPEAGADACQCDTWSGRINDLYFIKCTEAITPGHLVDTAWWAALVANGKLRNTGVGIGSYGKNSITTFDAGGCGLATVQQVEWKLDYQIFCIDKSSSYATHEFVDALVKGALKNYNLVARFCDGDNVILPIGKVDIIDFDNALPSATTDFMSFTLSLGWKQLGVPTPLEVAGLSSVLPKATR
jgi:hypothetical protein